MERYLNLFSLALLGVAFTLFLTVFSVTPIVCGLGPNVAVPWSNTAIPLLGTETDLEIRVTGDRRIFIGPTIVPGSLLESELAAVARSTSASRHVMISADGTVPYSLVQDVLKASHHAGFRKLSLVTFRGDRLAILRRSGVV